MIAKIQTPPLQQKGETNILALVLGTAAVLGIGWCAYKYWWLPKQQAKLKTGTDGTK